MAFNKWEYDRARAKKIYQENKDKIKAKHAIWRKNNKLKITAQNQVNRAIKSGELWPLVCEKCGSEKTEAHHDDYSKPLEVRWLCHSHHALIHKNRKKKAVVNG